MNKDLSKNLIHILNILEQSLDTLNYSIKVCNQVINNNSYSYDDLSEFEALTSRFARVSDILTQKLLKTIFMLLREDAFTFIDRCHLAEKLEMITSSDDLKNIRDLRNSIAHEYLIEDLTVLFKQTLTLAPKLIENITKIKKYITEKKLI